MIKFFRHIRQNLLTENKFSKYLIYAVGEIILVVIGILLALQINNWNSERISKEKESVYLSNIKRDLKEQLAIIDSQMAYEQEIMTIATPILTYYKETNAFKVDSLFTASIGVLTGRRTFVKNTPTYTELISSGNIDIIRDNVLKDQIIMYYQNLERDELVINKNNNLFTDAVFVIEALRLSELQIRGDYTNMDFAATINMNKTTYVDLNEPRLKMITQNQLKKPENELRFINSINFRNSISMIHLGILNRQRETTLDLLEKF